MTDEPKNAWKTFTEEIDVTGQQLVAEINRLLAEGNVRRLEIRSEQGDIFLAVPLTAGAIAGGVVAIAAPWLAVIAAIAVLVTKVKLVVVRDGSTAAKDQSEDDTGQPGQGGV